MNCGQPAIERGDLLAAHPGKMTAIRIGDLAMADKSDDEVAGERQVVRPELVALQGLNSVGGGADVASRMARAQDAVSSWFSYASAFRRGRGRRPAVSGLGGGCR